MKEKKKKAKICPYCDYSWIPRTESPKQCPNCKRYLIPVKLYKVFCEGDLYYTASSRVRAARVIQILKKAGLTCEIKTSQRGITNER